MSEAGMKNDARLDLRLPTDLKDRIEMAAEGSVNAWIRDACERKMDPYRGSVDPEAVAMIRKETSRQAVTEVDEIPLPKIAPRKWGA